jgi:hypothetical protein
MKHKKLLTVLLAFGFLVIVAVITMTVWSSDRFVVKLTKQNTQDYSVPVKGEFLKVIPVNAGVQLEGMDLVAENDSLALFLNKVTTEIAVKDKSNGQLWYSNPQDREKDSLASPFEKGALSSQISLTYVNPYNTIVSLLSFNDSVEKKQFEVESIPNGIRIVYTLGDASKGLEALPRFISKKRMDAKLVSKLSEVDARDILKRYTLNKETNTYERFDAALKAGVALEKVVKVFNKAGYSEEDLKFDNTENKSGAAAESNKPKFVVPLEYRLDGANLVATIPAEQIVEPKNAKIIQLEMLRYFGAAGIRDNGFMLVPDGAGSLIYLNNGKIKDDSYSQRIYGADLTNSDRNRSQISETARIPVFGIKTGDRAVVSIIDGGEAAASVNAEISGKLNHYNYAYSSYTLREKDSIFLTGNNEANRVLLIPAQSVKSNLTVRYGFLYGKQADLPGMADQYRNLLISRNQLHKLAVNEQQPFYLDVLGSVPQQTSYLGIPYKTLLPFTTYKEAGLIVDELQKSKVSNIELRYMGWFNKGVNHALPARISPDGVLGGKAGFSNFAGQMSAKGVSLYPDVAFQQVYQTGKGFKAARDADRFITRDIAIRNPYNLARNRQAGWKSNYYLLSASKLPGVMDSFIRSYTEYGLKGLSLRDAADQLNSDYRVNRVIDRQLSKNIVVEQMEKLQKQVPNLMAVGGNAYALPYVKHIIDAPLDDSKFNITDEAVPFFQMVIHGYIDYSGKAVNLSDDQNVKKALLKNLEYGANVHFTWTYKDSSEFKNTEFDSWYSVHYKTWILAAEQMYAEVQKVLNNVRNQHIVKHTKLQNGVFETIFENGKWIKVNYNSASVTVNGVTVDALSYATGGGDQ